MTDICYPPGADWSCAYSKDELFEICSDPVKSAMKQRSEALAWMQLAALTADQLGTCPITVRPCTRACLDHHVYLTASTRGGPFHPHINSQGNWVNSCGCAAGDCSCTALSEVILPGPVGDVLEVLLDGAVLDPTAYRVDNGNRLVRTDGGIWPACQNMAAPTVPADDAPDEALGTFEVTYYQGAAPDALSLWMAGLLAVEYFKACSSDKSCRLPNRLQSVARQGVTYNIAFEDDGTTGIREVDDYVRRLNPYHLKMPPVIVSPQSRRTRQTTWSRR